MTKIIAFVDGSAYSKSVCDHAAWVALRTGASVSLIHVLPRRTGSEGGDLSGAISLGARSALLEQLSALDAERAKLLGQKGRAILDDAAQILKDAGVADVTTQMRHGDVAQTVAEYEGGAAMVLIGKRGEGHAADLDRAHIGENLERILRAATHPVLIAARGFAPITKVLVAWDGQAPMRRAVDHIARDPMFAGLAVRLVCVGAPDADARHAMDAACAVLADAGISAQADFVQGEVAPSLAALAQDEGFGLVVMGGYSHSKLRGWVLGSTTTAMIRSCKTPLLVMY